MYRYLGTNGIIESPVHLEDIYYIRFLRLTADDKKMLTNGSKVVKSVEISMEDEQNWREINV